MIDIEVTEEFSLEGSSGEHLSALRFDASDAVSLWSEGEWGGIQLHQVMFHKLVLGLSWVERLEWRDVSVEELTWGVESVIHQWSVTDSRVTYPAVETLEERGAGEVYLREVFFRDTELDGAIFSQTTITSFARLDRVTLRDNIFADTTLEGECRLHDCELLGSRIFYRAKCLNDLTLDGCFIGSDSESHMSDVTVEGTLRASALRVARSLELDGACLGQAFELNEWSVILSESNKEVAEREVSYTRPLYQVNLSGVTCSRSLVISSPRLIGDNALVHKQRSVGGVRLHLNADQLNVSERLDLSRLVSQSAKYGLVGSISLSAQGMNIGVLNTPTLSKLSHEGGPISYLSQRSLTGDPQRNIHRMSRVADLYDEYLWATLIADHSSRRGAKSEESLYRAQASSLLLKAMSVASPFSSFIAGPVRWFRYSILNGRGGLCIPKLISKLLIISLIAFIAQWWSGSTSELMESIELVTLGAWGEPLQSLIGVELSPSLTSEISQRSLWLIAVQRLWGIWVVISSAWSQRRLIGEATLSSRLSALLRRS